MRFGNTREELDLSDWEPFANRRVWYLVGHNYPVLQVVYAEFRGPALASRALELPVERSSQFEDGAFPFIRIPDARTSNEVLGQRFDTWNERWVSYQDAFGFGNVFFPMTHAKRGGADGRGYVWTDASRWSVDAPEEPDSILVALNYWKWMFPQEWRARTGLGERADLSDVVVNVQLRGRALRLAGAEVTFWILCDGARWHAATPLAIENDLWTANRIDLRQESNWRMSWSRENVAPAICLDRVESYGFAFRGFSRNGQPSGIFEMDEFVLMRETGLPSGESPDDVQP
jgi:hypothetical protein